MTQEIKEINDRIIAYKELLLEKYKDDKENQLRVLGNIKKLKEKLKEKEKFLKNIP